MRRSTFIVRTCVLTTAASLCSPPSRALAQTTQVDLRSQTKGVDFSQANSTRPFKTGTTLPATCNVGESYFKTDAPIGQNLYGCTTANGWTVESGGGLPALSGNADHLLGTDGTRAGWVSIGGDVTGSPSSLLVNSLQGHRVATTTPADGQVLRWNSNALDWEPATLSTSFSTSTTSSNGNSGSTAGGDLFGTIANATVTRLQNKPVSAATPADGQVLTWSQSGGQWQPASQTGQSGPAASSTLNVLGVSYSSPSTITIGAGCSVSNPCNVRFGSNVLSITTSSTATWQSGFGPAYLYVTSSGTVTVGSNLAVTCSTGCFATYGIASFPTNTIPLYIWNATSNGWDPAGGRDVRAYMANKILSSGTGVLLVESGLQSTIGVDTSIVPTYFSGTGTLAFNNLAANSCSADLLLSVPGALGGDAIAPGWPASLPSSVFGTMRVSSADTVAVRLCNLGSTVATAASASYRATVVRGL